LLRIEYLSHIGSANRDGVKVCTAEVKRLLRWQPNKDSVLIGSCSPQPLDA